MMLLLSTLLAGQLTLAPASPKHGFQFPYFLYLPDKVRSPATLVIEPNSTGKPDDDFEAHLAAAQNGADGSRWTPGHFVADELSIPLLVPVFPRPAAQGDVYTHALDRDTILIRRGKLARIDLQLIAMIRDARRRLRGQQVTTASRVLLTGFSASASFVNRFMFLHPEMVRGVALGAMNAILMLPLASAAGVTLDYPLGVHDYRAITGRRFDVEAVRRIPQYLYMGEHDDNDAAPHGDAYSDEERRAIYTVLGEKMMPDRWEKAQACYREARLKATFKTYTGIGHETNGLIKRDIATFFRANL